MRTRFAAASAAVVVLVLTAMTVLGVAVARDGSVDQSAARMQTMPGAEVRSEYLYLAEMVAHHREAVAAAEELRRSERAELRSFGESIVTTQSAQIRLMQGWLADWYPDRPGRVEYHPMMRDLTGLTGDRLDRTFLRDMIGHHMAAVMMSQQLLMRGLADHPEVVSLAREIRDEQHAEIFRMQSWLWQWFGQGWTHGQGRAHGQGWAHRQGPDDRWSGPGMHRGMHHGGSMAPGMMG
jgi:uncharacterized protein (DUF305 family)